MVDLQSLFKWSMKYQDGNLPFEYKEMSAEDKLWLEGALKNYKYNDEDRMQEICKILPDKTRGD